MYFVPYVIPNVPQKTTAIIGIILSAIGFLASLLWLGFIRRYQRIAYYWVASARELERLMGTNIRAFCRGKDFASGKIIRVDNEEIGYDWTERMGIRVGFFIVYLVIILIFITLIVLNILRFVGYSIL